MRVYNFDLSTKHQQILQTGITLVADDEESNKLSATIIDIGENIDLNDYEILWLFRKRSRESVVYTKEHLSIDDNILSIVLTAKALNVVGSVESEIKFIKRDKVYTTQPFMVYIRKPIGLVDIGNEVGITISDIVDRLNDINSKYEDLLLTGGLSAKDKEEIQQALKDISNIRDEVIDILDRLEETNIDELLDNIEGFQDELIDLSEAIVNHYEDIEFLTSNVEDINNTLTHTYNYVEVMKNDIASVADTLTKLSAEQQQIKSQHTEDFEEVNVHINKILNDYQDLIDKVDGIVVSLGLLTDTDLQLSKDMQNITNLVEQCKTKIIQNTDLINKTNQTVADNNITTNSMLQSFSVDIDNIHSDITNINSKVGQQVDKIEKVNTNIDNVQANVVKINTTINDVNKDVGNLQILYQELLDKLSNISIPIKLSDLENDLGYVTKADLDDIDVEIPTLELDEIKNDITLIKQHNAAQDAYLKQVATNEDIKDFITLDDLPSVDLSGIDEQIKEIYSIINNIKTPTATSELVNDSGFITIDDIPPTNFDEVYDAIAKNSEDVSEQLNTLPTYADIPTNLSELANDVNFVTLEDIPSIDLADVNQKIDDLRVNLNNKIIELPTQQDLPKNLSELTNDVHFVTKKDIPLEDIHQTQLDVQAISFDIDNINTLLRNKVDKVTGKGLSTNDFTDKLLDKLTGIAQGANYYEHPAKHAPNIIEETEDKQFVSSAEKTEWNNKAANQDVQSIYADLTNIEKQMTAKLDKNEAIDLYETKANKGFAGGYAPLNDRGQIPLHHLPDISKHQLFIVDNEKDKQNLQAAQGDTVYIVNTGDSYIYDGSEWTVLAKADWENVNLDWFNIENAPSASVEDIDKAVKVKHIHANQKLLDALITDDITQWNQAYSHTLDNTLHVSASNKTYWDNKANIDDINELEADINQDLTNIHKKYNEIKKAVEQKANNINVEEKFNRLQVDINNKAPLLHSHSDYEKQLTALEKAMPTKVGDLNNDKGFITLRDLPKESVTSVNGKQGRVELLSGDIRYRLLSSDTVYDKIEEIASNINALQKNAINKDYLDKRLERTITNINGLSGPDVTLYGDKIKLNTSSDKTLTEVVEQKADKLHTHTAEDIVETENKQFISSDDKYNIAQIQNKADKLDIPTKVGELTNDKGFITAADIPSESVTSVNNQQGNVELTGNNISINKEAGQTIAEVVNIIEGDVKSKADLSHVTAELDTKADKDNVVASINGNQGVVELTGEDIPFNKWNSLSEELSLKANIWDLQDKADKGEVVTSINGQTGDIELNSKEEVIPRHTNTPLNDEIYIKDKHITPFDIKVDRVVGDVTVEKNVFTVNSDEGYSNIYLSVVGESGILNVRFEQTSGYYSYTHKKINGDDTKSGWVAGDKEFTLNVDNGDTISVSTGEPLVFRYDEPEPVLVEELFFRGEPISQSFDATDILTDIKELRRDMGYKADTNNVVTSVNNKRGDVVLNSHDIQHDNGNSVGATLVSILEAVKDVTENIDGFYDKIIKPALDKKANIKHNHNLDEFIYVGSKQPDDGRLWIQI